jgi:hypothetical protein
MSVLMGTLLTSMKAAFSTAPTPIHRIPTLASLINLMMQMCCCLQTQKTPASATMNMLFLAASPDLHSYFTNKTHPSGYFSFPKEVDDARDFSACTSDNKHKSLKSTHARNPKTRADIVTMNAALSDVFLANLPKGMHETTKHCLSQHVWLVHHKVRAYHNQRLQGKLAENGHHLASLRRFLAPCNMPFHWCFLRQRCTLLNGQL